MKYDYGIKAYRKKKEENIDRMGRIIGVYSYYFTVATSEQVYYNVEMTGTLNQKLHEIDRNLCIGDFVRYKSLSDGIILEDILTEYNKISKKVSAIQTKEQLLATNIDNVFITISCDQDFSIGLLERYLYSFSNDTFHVYLLLTKSDLEEQLQYIKTIIHDIYPELTISAISIYEPQSFVEIYQKIEQDSTSVFIGRSGSGKSTLINHLIGENRQKINQVNQKNNKGKHTTTSSVILPLKGDMPSYLIDTPGIKSIAVWNESNTAIFSDIERIEKQCQFTNCTHEENQLGCAIQQAIEIGVLDKNRFKRYLSLTRELNRTNMSYIERTKRNNRVRTRQNKKKRT